MNIECYGYLYICRMYSENNGNFKIVSNVDYVEGDNINLDE